MSLTLSKRSQVEGFRALEILSEVAERRANGENIISLSPGQPCFGAPAEVLSATQKCLTDDPVQGYTAAIGTLPLRQRIAAFYDERYGEKIDVGRVAVTSAASGGLLLSLMNAFEAGDTVALTLPTYPAYKNILQSLDIKIVEIETSKKDNYQPNAKILDECGEKFDGIIITNPSNPTGAMIGEDDLKDLCTWCDTNNVRLVSDEAYHGITYEQPAQTALKYSNNVIVLNTFSKYFALTGFRLGWVILPENMAPSFKALAENLYVSPPTISQYVALESFNHTDKLDEYVETYRANRDLLLERLPSIGFNDLSSAQGAFYFYVDVHNLTNDSEAFCRRMLEEAKVAMTPGLDFDSHRGSHTVRISYAGSLDDMNNACDRLEKWLA